MNQFAILYEDRFVRPSVCISTRLEHGNSDTPSDGVNHAVLWSRQHFRGASQDH